MEYVYIVRHKTFHLDENEELQLRITTSVFRTIEGANESALQTAIALLGFENIYYGKERIIVRSIEDSLSSDKAAAYKSFNVPCNWDEEGNRLEDDLIEVEKFRVQD